MPCIVCGKRERIRPVDYAYDGKYVCKVCQTRLGELEALKIWVKYLTDELAVVEAIARSEFDG